MPTTNCFAVRAVNYLIVDASGKDWTVIALPDVADIGTMTAQSVGKPTHALAYVGARTMSVATIRGRSFLNPGTTKHQAVNIFRY